MLKEHLTQNFIAIKFKELLAEKQRQELGEEYDISCAGTNCTYNMCIEYWHKQTEPVEDFSFHVDDI
jgi:hypothetical protein